MQRREEEMQKREEEGALVFETEIGCMKRKRRRKKQRVQVFLGRDIWRR
jgi:hypothetical protein